jgi:hypothetical protein
MRKLFKLFIAGAFFALATPLAFADHPTQTAAAEDVETVHASASDQSANGWRRLNADEISKMLSGATLHSSTGDGRKFTLRFSSDGKVAGESEKLNATFTLSYDQGTWRVTETKLCVNMREWYRKENCWGIEQSGDNQLRYASNLKAFTVTH